MNVYIDGRPAHGPGDLSAAGAGDTVHVLGAPNRDRDYGRWAPAIGAAVLRGANVRRTV